MKESKKTGDEILVKGAFSDNLKGKNVGVTGDFHDVLDAILRELLDQAAKRREDNGRKTSII